MQMIEEIEQKQEGVELDAFTRKRKLNKSAIAGIIYLICCVCFVGVKILNLYHIIDFKNSVIEELFSATIIQLVILFSLPVLLFTLLSKQTFKQTFKEFSFKKIKPISILYSIIIGICACVLVNFISTLFYSIITALGAESLSGGQAVDPSQYSIGMFFLVVLTSCIMPGVCEELAHRGMLLGAYKKYGVVFAVTITSVLFGLMHMNIYQCFYAFAVGLLFAYVCVYTKSIWPGIIMHFMNNFLNTLWDFSYYNNWLGGGLYGWRNYIAYNYGGDIYYFVNVIVTIVAFMGLVYFVYKLIRKERLNDLLKNVPANIQEQYEQAKQNPALEFFVKKSFVANNVQEYYYQQLKKEARRQKMSFIEYIENGGNRQKHAWYDNVFVYTALILGSFYTLYTFFFLVV